MSEKRVIATVISTLEKLACKFKSASDLIEAIKKYGLFEGRAQLEDGKWHLLSNTKRFHKPTSWATYGTFPGFVCLTIDKNWYCCLGYEDTRLILGFRKEDGSLVHVEPDELEEESYEDAVDEVLNLCNIIWFPFSRKPLFQ